MWEPTDWIAAIAVITGPLGALSVAFYTARQHVRHHAQAQKEERRVAVRLLRAEIEAADARVQSMLDWERWPIHLQPGWTSTWGKYRAPVAAAIRQDDEYSKVLEAFIMMEKLEAGFDAGPRDFVETDRDFLPACRTQFRAALNVLERL